MQNNDSAQIDQVKIQLSRLQRLKKKNTRMLRKVLNKPTEKASDSIQIAFRQHSNNIQTAFRQHSDNIQTSYRQTPDKSQRVESWKFIQAQTTFKKYRQHSCSFHEDSYRIHSFRIETDYIAEAFIDSFSQRFCVFTQLGFIQHSYSATANRMRHIF